MRSGGLTGVVQPRALIEPGRRQLRVLALVRAVALRRLEELLSRGAALAGRDVGLLGIELVILARVVLPPRLEVGVELGRRWAGGRRALRPGGATSPPLSSSADSDNGVLGLDAAEGCGSAVEVVGAIDVDASVAVRRLHMPDREVGCSYFSS